MTELDLSGTEQKKHDDVIEFVKANLIKDGFKVKINKHKDKNNVVCATLFLSFFNLLFDG